MLALVLCLRQTVDFTLDLDFRTIHDGDDRQRHADLAFACDERRPMQHVFIDRTDALIAALDRRRAVSDPDGLYAEATVLLSDLAEAFAAAQEVIAALRQRLDTANRR